MSSTAAGLAVSTPQIEERLQNFALFLRENDITPGPAAIIDAARLCREGFLIERQLLKHGLRSCFCHCADDWHRFEELFEIYWSPPDTVIETDVQGQSVEAPTLATQGDSGSLVGFAGTSSQQMEDKLAGAGDFKALSLADFRFVFDPYEKQLIEKMVDDLARRSRRSWMRRRVKSRRGSSLDTRTTIKKSVRFQGQLMDLRFLARQRKLPSFVLLVDVSQSMEVYAKLFLRYICRLMQAFRQSEAFAFNTELLQLGSGFHQMSESELEDAINKNQQRWLGGTKIARSLETFNQQYARHTVSRTTTVVIFSDGCDTATPEELAPQVAALQRRARQLIWVNPLLGRFKEGEKDPYMDPITPFVDRYRSAHNLQSLQLLTHDLLSSRAS